METLEVVQVLRFLFRAVWRASADTASFFGADMKTVVTVIVLLCLGFLLSYKVRGAIATQAEVSNFVILTGASLALFLAALLAPYLVYLEEHRKISAVAVAADKRATVAEVYAPHNSAITLRVERSCADRLFRTEGDK